MGTVSHPPGSEGKKTGAGWPAIALVAVVAALILTAARGYLKTKSSASSGGESSPTPAVRSGGKTETPAAQSASLSSMNGWLDFRWGMSQAEVDEVIRLKKFGVAVRKNNDKGEPVIHLTRVSVGNFWLDPALHFGRRGLDFIFLFCPEDKATITAYEQLKAHMVREIGLPPIPDDGVDIAGVPFRFRGAVWSFPETTVEIKFAGSIEKPGNALYISYRDPASIGGN